MIGTAGVVGLDQPRRCCGIFCNKRKSFPTLVATIVSPVVNKGSPEQPALIFQNYELKITVIRILGIVALDKACTGGCVRCDSDATLPGIGHIPIVVPIVNKVRSLKHHDLKVPMVGALRIVALDHACRTSNSRSHYLRAVPASSRVITIVVDEIVSLWHHQFKVFDAAPSEITLD